MRNMLLAIAAALLVVAPVMADDSYESGDAAWTVGEPGGIPTWTMSRDVIYESGPLLTGVGTGVGGADESILQSVSLGMSTLGFGHQWALGYWIADAFEVPAGETWDIDQITFFAYQTGSPTQSTITGVYFEIREFDVAGPVVGGDMAINALVSTDWTGMYRVTETTTGVSADRPIMANVCSLDPVSLGEGIYTIVWATDGTLSSGPWAPPITIVGEPATGEGLQSLDGGVTFDYVIDSGSGTGQGFPFILEGGGTTPVEDSTWGELKSLFR